ncbi:MAG: hypothetical protein SFU86_01805, partial [Pirellulaceae bacterium]|nr:hypothetical protein [Pirellulaceae bacterium]
MSRQFRLLEKKRGQRRTGSNLVGSVGEAIFSGVLFLLGSLSLSAILGSQLIHPNPESFAFGVGMWLLVLVLASFVIIGGAGLIWTVLRVGASAERRSAMARQAVADMDSVTGGPLKPRSFPTVPPYDGLTNSPGIDLAYRLPPAESPGWRLLATAIFTLLWNFVACVLLVWAVRSHIALQPEWFLTIFLAPFLAVSVWATRYLLELIWIHNGMGMTTIEVSDHPLIPGREYQVVLAQHGHIMVKSLELLLVCEEEAT